MSVDLLAERHSLSVL